MNPSWLLAAVLALPALAAPPADPVRAAVASLSRGNVPESGGIPALVRSLTEPQRREARARLGALDKTRLSPEQADELAHAYRLLDDADALAPNAGRRATPGALLANAAANALNTGRYEEAMRLAALALKAEPGNREALTVLNFSRGRTSSADSTAASPAAAPRARIRKGLRLQSPARLRPAAPPPNLAGDAGAPARPGPLPLLPIAALGLGAAAFTVYRSRAAYESRDGLDDEHPTEYGSGQRFVTGAIMAACAGAALYLAGSALVSAAPLALRYAAPVAAHGTRLAQSETGAINPGETQVINEVPRTFARVIPYTPEILRRLERLGMPNQSQVFVTAADDISGLSAAELQQRLAIEPSSAYIVIRFSLPAVPVATPIAYANADFIGRGLTAGGAREFYIPNELIPSDAMIEIVR